MSALGLRFLGVGNAQARSLGSFAALSACSSSGVHRRTLMSTLA